MKKKKKKNLHSQESRRYLDILEATCQKEV